MDAPLLEASGLGYSFRQPVLEGFDLEVGRGEIVVLLGLNGAGKTTALRLLSGQRRPQEGRVRVGGGDPRRASVRRGLFFLPEVSELPEHLSAREVLRFHARLFGKARPRRSEVDRLLDRVGLSHVSGKRATTFSKGMQRRLELGALLAVDPPLWILDEPRSGLDPEGLELLRDLCREARERGRAVVMSTHALRDVRDLADAVVVLEGGRTRFAGSRAGLAERVGAAEFVLEGGGHGAEEALRAAAAGAGAELRGPYLPVEALERELFRGRAR